MAENAEAVAPEGGEAKKGFSFKDIVSIKRPGQKEATKVEIPEKKDDNEEGEEEVKDETPNDPSGGEQEEAAVEEKPNNEDENEESGSSEEAGEGDGGEEEALRQEEEIETPSGDDGEVSEEDSDPAPAEEFNIYEFTEGVFESKDELKRTSDLLKNNPELKQMLEFYEKNGTLLPYLQATQVNVDNFTDLQILQEAFKSENSDLGLTGEELMLMFEEDVLSKYDLESEDETRRKIGAARIKREAAKLRQELKEEQQALLLPKDRDRSVEIAEKLKADQQEKISAQKNKLAFQIRKEIKDGKLEVKVSDDVSVKLEASPKKISDLLDKNPDASLFLTKEGNFDIKRMAILTDTDAFISSVMSQAEVIGKKKFVAEELKGRKPAGKTPEGSGTPNEIKKLDPRDPRSFKGAKIINR